MDKLRVLHLLESWPFTSAGASKLPLLSQYRNKEFFEVEFGAVNECDERRRLQIEHAGARIHVFDGDHEALANFLKEGVDILHITRAGYEMTDVIRTARIAKVPIIVDLNAFGLFGHSEEEKEVDFHLIQSKTAALRYISASGAGMEAFLRNGGVMYLPMDLERFDRIRPSDSQRDRLRSRLELEDDTPVICRIGRADMNKWSLFAIHMFSLVVERNPKVRFVIIGGVPPEVNQMIERLGLKRYFRILPPISDDTLVETLFTTDLLAHSSHIGESFGATIAEAMAARRPVVVNSTDWADNAQIEVVDHTVTGLIANTPRSYADAVLYLLRNKAVAERMGQNGYEKAARVYSGQTVTRSVERLYANLADMKNLKRDPARRRFYQSVPPVPSSEEIRQWPTEYRRRLLASGYSLGSFERNALRTAWMATNLFRGLRRLQIPQPILASKSSLGYAAAIT